MCKNNAKLEETEVNAHSRTKRSKKKRSFFGRRDFFASLSVWQKMAYVSFCVILILLSTLALGFSSLLLAYGNGVPDVVFITYLKNPYVLSLNLIPPILLFVVLYVVVGRAWAAYLADCIVVLGFSVANYFKLMFRNDPLMFTDIMYAGEAAAISKEGYNYQLSERLVFVLALCLFFVLMLCVFHRHKLKAAQRIYILAFACIFIFPLKDVYFDREIYTVKTDNIRPEHMNKWSPTNQYLSKGFVYPFIYSIQNAFEVEPDGYNGKEVKAILDSYPEQSIPEDKKVNVIGIMLEAYSDLETLGISGIRPETYEYYRKLRDENLSGTLVTNIFAAGTIDTERGFLSGFTGLDHCRRMTNSYVHYFADNGYKTMGSHPSEDWFYNRRNVNEYLGFSDYRFRENYFEEKYGLGQMRSDTLVFDDFYEQYKEVVEEGKEPYFGFNVTYQGHGPYPVNYRERGTNTNPLYENPAISEQSNNIMNNYLASLKETGFYLNAFVEKIMVQTEPTVVVFFGDHKPWLGDSNSVYNELGISFDLSTKEGFLNYYSTEYVIVANDAAKQLLGNEFKGKGPTTSPCFLMNVLFDEMGIEGPQYMQYTNSVRERIVALNRAGVLDNEGNYYTLANLPEDLRNIYNEYQRVAFYERTNFRK